MINKLRLFVLCSLFSCSTTGSNFHHPIYDIKIKLISGEQLDLSKFKGKKILFVNVASKCGFTKQYTSLEKMHQVYKDQLIVIGVPCNQFGSQEPGDHQEIIDFCQDNYGVSFLITEKIKVKGEGQHPLYRWLCNKKINGKIDSSVKWNFQKYLVDEDGNLLDYFYSITDPMSSKITRYFQ